MSTDNSYFQLQKFSNRISFRVIPMNKAITAHNSIADDYAPHSGTQASMVRQIKENSYYK